MIDEPDPSQLKIQSGTSRLASTAQGAIPLTDLPECPGYLDDTAKSKWAELCQTLGEMGLLTGADRDVMAMYCTAFGEWREAADMVKKSGLVIKTAGGIGANPCVQIAANAKREMLELSALLGLDPTSRDRFRVRRKGPLSHNATG